MHKASQNELDITFPKKYLQKFQEYRKRSSELTLKPKQPSKPSGTPQIFSSHCKQAISLAKAKIYCCVLKEIVQGAICKACPCHEPEPLDYTLYKRV